MKKIYRIGWLVALAFCLSADEVTWIAAGDPVKVIVPTDSSLESVWNDPAYTPGASWISGTTGVGYENGSGYEAWIETDIKTETLGVNATFYMRQTFSLATTSGVSSLTLRLRLDDGCAVYLNGTQVLVVNAPSSPSWNSQAITYSLEAKTIFDEFDLSAHTGLLQTGDNLLAIQAMNHVPGSSDFLVLSELVAEVDLTHFQVTATDPVNGAQVYSAPTQMTVNFGTALNASTVAASDLKIDGISATGYTVLDSDTVRFDLPAGLSSGAHTATFAENAIEASNGFFLSSYSGTFSIVTLATIQQLPVSGLYADQATLNARLTDTGGDDPSVSFAWGDNDGGTNLGAWDAQSTAGFQTATDFFTELVSLAPGTTWYYRALAVNAAGTRWATSTSSFTTPSVALPTLGTPWVSGIYGSGAQLNGSVIGTGGENPAVHLVWGLSNGGTILGAWDHNVDLGVRGVAGFSTTLSGLTTNTTYYFSSYANNSAGTTWSSIQSFETLDLVPVVTEFMASNDSTLTDGFGNTPDWIEIHNPAGVPQDLTGWYLTDNWSNLTKWQFPSASISAGGYLVVFASKADTTDPSGYLHTSFSLSAGGEYVALVRPDSTIVSDYTFTQQYADISYGLSPDQSQVRFFETPTPGAANNTDYWDLVKDTKFSVDRGFYTNAFDVAITTATAGATIRYTTDGSRPTETHGTVYTAPININKTTVLRAFGYLSGFESSDVDAQTYIFIDDIVNQPSDPAGWPDPFDYIRNDWNGVEVKTVDANWGVNIGANETAFREALTNSLTISLSTDMNVLFDLNTGIFGNPNPDIALDHAISVEIFNAGDGKSTQLNAVARMMGTASGFPDRTKPNLRLLFKSEFVDATSGETLTGPGKLDYPLFENSKVKSFNTIALRGMLQRGLIGWSGPAIQDAYTHETYRDLGHLSVQYRFVNVYINGLYMGVFQAQERSDDSYMEEHLGGAREDYDVMKQGGLSSGTADAWNKFKTLVPTESTLSEANYQIVKNDYLDLERYADYMMLEMFIANNDWPTKNFYMDCQRGSPAYGPPAQKWIPFTWDADLAIDKNNVGIDLYGKFVTWNATSPLGLIWNALHNNSSWQRFFGDRVHRNLFNGGELSVERMNARWLRVRDELNLVAMGEFCKWSNRDLNWWNTEILSYTTDFWPQRHVNSLQQLRSHGLYPITDAPVYSQHGGEVSAGYGITMTHPNGSGTIWYTIDDSDPRDSATAIAYTGSPVVISETTRMKACVDSGAEWSAMNGAIFQVKPTLIVSEIMYNPIGTGSFTAQEYEFIEIYNTGTSSVDLSGIRFSTGIDCLLSGTLSAGEYAVAVKNPVAFSSRYSTNGMRIAGIYSNELSNAGERIMLVEKYDAVVVSFVYSDLWHPTTDGDGFSLVHRESNPETNPNLADFWEVSPDYLGSPGETDLDMAVLPILVNELLSHTDWPQVDAVELYNPNATEVDLGGWWLSDNAANLKRFEIPVGTTIPAGGYRVIYEDNDGNTNTVPPAAYFGREFSYSSLGEQVFLASPTRRWVHGFYFGASANGVSFGRVATSDGNEHFVAQNSLTLGTANSGPKSGPLVITELMVDPPAGYPEYMELRNISDASISLFDEANPANTWGFIDGIGYSFPAGVTVPAGGIILLIATNETAFRNAWNPEETAPVFGPYNGKLGNSGEDLELARPDTPNADGSVPLISSEQVRYLTASPWPTGVSGTGAALEKTADSTFGNEPLNWRSSNLSGSPGSTPQEDTDADQLPDNWELKYFGQLDHPQGAPNQDFDGDGHSNWEEYVWGTDPQVADQGLQLRIDSDLGTIALEFDSVLSSQSGYFGVQRVYGLQQCLPLVTTNWTDVPGQSRMVPTGAPILIPDLSMISSKWYRVRATLE